ncbi:phospho-acceptor domain-containing protein [Novosphingobium sp. PhB57]|uniref:GAF domain-containing sensor histidine kinase n=1 Tax=Novosphingobium sp. PhB57 TaxID=2485107 RepID=UPI0010457D57|nr:GAF domain-containing sensor histidine kinase [Novosphingobium sp. PhB57]TCU54619.1 phospho-acceptor domain-containing protein [Novosphingobium sp. PhB57]
MNRDFAQDIELIEGIKSVPTILDVVCQTTGMGFCAVARVTEERWVTCSVKDDIGFGLKPGDELKIETTICHEIREHREVVVIDDVSKDPVYFNHHTPKHYGLQSYISMPIILADGTFFGTLCAISPKPATVKKPHIVSMFKLFADMIAHQIELNRTLKASASALLNEQETSALREQFIAVLGHDLRNPLAGISAGMNLLSGETLSDRGTSILGMMNHSVSRMAGLIDNVMDFARGRLGGGLTLSRTLARLTPVLQQVIDELVSGHPDRVIEADLNLPEVVNCDPVRVGQLLSNLVGNALTHGAPDFPVRVNADVAGALVELKVSNAGEPIPEAARAKLFAPFSRGEVRPSLQGLGLGLYIASQIAKAHGGSLSVASNEVETTFSFQMPLEQPAIAH